ncbi:FimV/HubP family polar landmark protein [Pseudomonas sp. UBA4194]|uniref:FimV/HubP family polar landmark protein n=1 Tax=Pseudomonas sp. UBA4194 TaxID=1947317 RepID=UPI0025FE9478|nr:FimV/HubP family polar landmark protein [Pseudomonas sp. UBA4194]
MSVRSPSRSRLVQGRLLAAMLATAGLCYSAVAPALGLGDITLRSSLNQPFRADIELLDTAGLEESDVRASLGTVEEFSRAGVDRDFFLNDLKFTPDFRGSRKVIRVSSSKAATEPYLSFVVQVARPNGQLLRTFTVLLDPPGMGPGLADRAPQRAAAAPAAATQPAPQRAQPPVSNTPAPAATQGKRYEVAKGDTLWSIGKRLEAAGTPTPINDLVRGIRVLNPDSAPLKVGQSLLLPDAAVLPGTSAAPAATTPSATSGSDTTPAAGEQPAAQLAATALENQQLQKNFDDLQARLQSLETLVADKDKQVTELQTQLAEVKQTPAAAPAPVAPPAVQPAPPAPAPAAAAPVSAESDSSGWLNILALVALLLLVVALLLLVRRQRQRNAAALDEPLEPVLVKPAQSANAVAGVASTAVVSEMAEAPVARAEPVVTPRKEAPPATDALDGASIYIAYGRYNEALGILREGVAKQPERTDLRLRMLEVLGQQGNSKGFAEQEAWLLAAGFSAAALLEVRSRYPAIAAAPAAVPEPEPEAEPEPLSAPVAPSFEADPVPDFDLSPEPVAQQTAEPVAPQDEFQLNLDDLSMDADWELVSPFDAAPAPKSKPAVQELSEPEEVDVNFASNLKEFPEVFEMPDEQFLSDFADADEEPFLELEDKPRTTTQEDIDNAFLDSFIADSDLPELDALTVDFDDLELQQASAQKLEDAQQYIDEGDLSAASHLLHELLREGDESCKQTARQLLSRIG